MNNYVKAAIVIVVVVIAALIIVPKMIGVTPTPTTGKSNDGSSLSMIDTTLKNGKPTLLLLRSET